MFPGKPLKTVYGKGENKTKMNNIKKSKQDILTDAVIVVFAVLALVICAYPLYFVIIASFSEPALVATGQITVLPKNFTFSAYEFILKEKNIWLGYKNTIIYTLGSILMGLVIIIPAGYALSRKDFIGRKPIMWMLTFTMFFNGGLIPTYITISSLHLQNTRFILMILGSVSVFNIIVTRTFFSSTLPDELYEAASIDGCGNTRFFFSIVLPLSSTIVAVIALYVGVWQWNSYFNALIYTTNRMLLPLQLVMRELLIQGSSLTTGEDMDAASIKYMMEITQLIKYGVIVVSTVPIICAYPFLQKYFVKGVMIGSVKG
jgi:putative aldouronate transport system permease protein